MKANAKKLLALILAMVMCLSLAAPAFAGNSGKTGEEPVALALQAATPTSIVAATDGSGKYTVVDANLEAVAAGNVTDEKQADSNVTVTKVSGGLIGEAKKAKYTVAYKGIATPTDVYVGTEEGTKTILDVPESDWKKLDAGQTVTLDGGATYYQVSGSVYQEKQGNGLVRAFFKLYKVNAKKDGFKTDEAPVNFATDAIAEIKTANDMSAALAKAKTCTYEGKATTPTRDDVVTAGVALGTTVTPVEYVVYSFAAMNESEGITVTCSDDTYTATTTPATVTTGTVKVEFATTTDLTTGSFMVKVTATNKTDTKKKPAAVTNADEVKKILDDRWTITNAKLEGVETASGDYLKVNVSKIATADPYEAKSTLWSKNVTSFETKPVLIDQTKDGWYKGTTEQGANSVAIAANTVALGPVAVKADALPVGKYVVTPGTYAAYDNTYYYFESVEAAKKGIKAKQCTDGTTVSYIQAVVNPWKGDKQNMLLQSTLDKDAAKAAAKDASQQNTATVLTLKSGWASQAYNTPNADFAVKGSIEVQANAHGPTVQTTEVTTAETCETPGVKSIKEVCTICKQVVSEKTEAIPVDTNPLEKKPGGDVEKDPKSISFEGLTGATSTHYVNKAVSTTTLSEDKTETIITTEYWCNYNVKHTEETHIQRIKKTNLQNSGRFNHFSISGRNDEVVITDGAGTGSTAQDDASNLFGYTEGITIADSDLELESLPLNRKSTAIIANENRTTLVTTTNALDAGHSVADVNDDLTFKFSASSGVKQADGSYVAYRSAKLDTVYATVTGTPVTKYYVAKLTAKNTKEPAYKCHTGAGTLTVEVYEVGKKADGFVSDTNFRGAVSSAANLEKNLKKGNVKLLQTYTKDATIRAQKYHDYDPVTGVCKWCLQTREAVESATFTADTITVENLKWTGKKVQPKVTVMNTKGEKLLKGVDYLLEEIEDTDAGEHTITIVGQDDYKGNRVTVPFTIEKVAATLKKKSAPSKLTASATKKVTGQIKMTVKGGKVAKYKVTKKVSGVSVNKSGKITVKKGNKKAGTLKVKVTMTPDANHTAAKAVTVKVAIKAAPAAKKTTKKK